MTLQGYPRRHQPRRRAAPATSLFDPSSDAACTGWWRADANLNVSNASRGLVSSLTSRLADQKVFLNASSPPWLLVKSASNGFPGLYPMAEGWHAGGIAQNGDRSITATWVMRCTTYRLNANQLMLYVDNMGGFGMWDNWIRLYHPYLGWWSVNDNAWFPWNPANISVLTIRIKPVDEAGGNFAAEYRLNWNTTFAGPFVQVTSYGDRVMTATHAMHVYGVNTGTTLFHEQIFFRRHLSDSEVNAMHNALLLQYGQAV
jgi:hypothetical protein